MQSDVESAATIRGALSDLYDGICGLNAERSRHQEPGSQAESEQADARWSQEIINACSIGTQLLESGGEHLTLFLKTITEPVEPIACWTCIRSMLEPCAFSAWLFEPQIDCAARAGRVFALRYEGMDQELKFGRIARQPQAVLDSISERIEATERKAIALGFRPLRNKKRERTGIGIVMPSATAVIGLML